MPYLMSSNNVLDVLCQLLMKHGKPEVIHSDNSPEFIAAPLKDFLRRLGIQAMQIYSGSPWETDTTKGSAEHSITKP